MGVVVAALVVAGLLILRDRATKGVASKGRLASPSPMRGSSKKVERVVLSVLSGLGESSPSPVDSAVYTQCSRDGCWKVHTATYILLANGLSSKGILSRLRKEFLSHEGLKGIGLAFQPFQWLKGEGLSVSFSQGGRLLGRYTFVVLSQGESGGEKKVALQFRPSVSTGGFEKREGPMVAIVIDDVGYTKHAADLFLDLPFPVTISVIPFTPFVDYAIRRARAKGKEVMLHIPMESGGHREAIERMESRTKGMLRVSMSDSAILSLLRREIAAVPGAVGANNHMGSRFTCNRHKMEVVLGELGRHGLFFLDSLTSSRSVAYRTALNMGVPALRRDIFLDHSHDRASMDRQFRRLAAIALKRGYAVAIGHPLTATYRMIKEGASKLRAMGIEIVPISRLLRRVEGAKHGRSGFQKARELNG